MTGFERENDDHELEVDSSLNWEPVQFDEFQRDGVQLAFVCDYGQSPRLPISDKQ